MQILLTLANFVQGQNQNFTAIKKQLEEDVPGVPKKVIKIYSSLKFEMEGISFFVILESYITYTAPLEEFSSKYTRCPKNNIYLKKGLNLLFFSNFVIIFG